MSNGTLWPAGSRLSPLAFLPADPAGTDNSGKPTLFRVLPRGTWPVSDARFILGGWAPIARSGYLVRLSVRPVSVYRSNIELRSLSWGYAAW